MKSAANSAHPGRWLFFWTLALSVLGLLIVFEVSVSQALSLTGNPFFFVRQQAVAFVIGWIGLLVAMYIPASWWQKASPILYVASVVMLVMVFIPGLGLSIKGARRWIDLGPVSFQPVEVAKLSIAVFFAQWLTKHQKLVPFLVMSGIPIGLLFLQPDMGSTLIVTAIAFGMFFVAGASLKIIGQLALLGVAFLALMVIIAPYRLQRITTFLNPEADPLGASFHIRQITLALGNGGILGQGIGKSKQKFSYIPEASTDSIFAIVAEEVGFVGSTILICMFGAYLKSVADIIRRIPEGSYEQLLATGIGLWLSAQIILNLAAVVALVPLTGVPLPFFSYGGTSLVMVLWVTGMLLGLGRSEQRT